MRGDAGGKWLRFCVWCWGMGSRRWHRSKNPGDGHAKIWGEEDCPLLHVAWGKKYIALKSGSQFFTWTRLKSFLYSCISSARQNFKYGLPLLGSEKCTNSFLNSSLSDLCLCRHITFAWTKSVCTRVYTCFGSWKLLADLQMQACHIFISAKDSLNHSGILEEGASPWYGGSVWVPLDHLTSETRRELRPGRSASPEALKGAGENGIGAPAWSSEWVRVTERRDSCSVFTSN